MNASTKLAVGSQSVVATLLMVPNQPLVFHQRWQAAYGRRPDRLHLDAVLQDG